MAYREPKSTIVLFKGCPCDTEYDNTIYFGTKLAQYEYFMSLPHKFLTDQYYQRYGKGTLRIKNSAFTSGGKEFAGTEDLYEYNYMMFSNDPNFVNPNYQPFNDSKIFYAFINSIEYINENTTEIKYTIDVMQTYMFDYTLGDCFVEREHSITDNFGENLIDEPFNPQFYIDHELVNKEFDHLCVQIKYVPNLEALITNYIGTWKIDDNAEYGISFVDEHVYAQEFTNMVSTAERSITLPIYEGYEGYIAKWTYGIIKKFIELSAVITDISIIPFELVTEKWAYLLRGRGSGGWDDINLYEWHNTSQYDYNKYASYTQIISVARPTVFYHPNYSSASQYTPINKKMYSYPYQKIKITNSQGETSDFGIEGFREAHQGTNISFQLEGCTYPVPEIIMCPSHYNGMTLNADRKIALSNFVGGSWSEDSASRYWVENKSKITASIIGGLAMMIAGAGITIATSGSGAMIGGAMMAGGMATMSGTVANTDIAQGKNLLQGNVPINQQQLFNNAPKSPVNVNPNPYLMAAGATAISHQVATMLDMYNKRDTVLGKNSFSNTPYFIGAFGFKIIYQGIPAYDAERIDNYFSMYGYKVNNVKRPNLYAHPNQLRPRWNYIKNVNTVVLPMPVGSGSDPSLNRYIPEEAEHAIKEIYNKGITFWMRGEYVGNYAFSANVPQVNNNG